MSDLIHTSNVTVIAKPFADEDILRVMTLIWRKKFPLHSMQLSVVKLKSVTFKSIYMKGFLKIFLRSVFINLFMKSGQKGILHTSDLA